MPKAAGETKHSPWRSGRDRARDELATNTQLNLIPTGMDTRSTWRCSVTTEGIGSPGASYDQQRSVVTTALLRWFREAGADLDTIVPIDDPLLWTTRCSLDAAVLLLYAYVRSATDAGQDREAVLEAIAAARAGVAAATFAARTDYAVLMTSGALKARRSPDEP